MAITITNQADLVKFVTSKDPILYEIETDNQPDRVKCEIFDEAAVLLATVTHYPLFGETDKFRFDISGIIDDLIGTDMYVNVADLPAATGYIDAPNSHLAFRCTFTSILPDDSDSDSDSDVGDTVTEDDLRVAIAAIFEPLDTTRMDDRVLLDNKALYLTNTEIVRRARLTDSFYYMVLFDKDDANNDPLDLKINKTNKDGTVDGANFTLPFAIDSDGDANYSYTIHIALGPADINNTLGTDFIDADVAYYTVAIHDSLGNPISRPKTIYVSDECKDYPIRLHFLNRLGGFDSFVFFGRNVREYDTNSKQFQSNYIEQKLGITQDDGYKVYSDFLNDNEAIVLRELLSSPEAYMEIDTAYMPIIVETKKLKVKDTDSGLVRYEIDFRFAHKTKAQRA